MTDTVAAVAYDREKAYETLTCPFCGRVEDSSWMLQQNHWLRRPGEAGYDWCAENGCCVAQNLIRNHLSWDVKSLVEGSSAVHTSRGGKFDPVKAKRSLEESMKAAREYGLDVDAIVAAFPIVCGHCKDGDHDDCRAEFTWSPVVDDITDCRCTECAP